MRLLIVKTSSMGDVVHAMPALSDIRAHHPDIGLDARLIARRRGLKEAERLAHRGEVGPLREGGLAKYNIKMLVDETYTPPLSDATSLMQKVRTTKPEVLIFPSTTISDNAICMRRMAWSRVAP